LRSQLALTNLGDRDRVFVQLLIDALDEDGYLTQPLEEIAALLPAEAEAAFEELRNRAQAPAEPGARRRGRAPPGECLALQLRIMPASRRGRWAARHRGKTSGAACEPRLHAPQEHHRRRRGGAAPRAAPDQALKSPPGRRLRQVETR